MLMVYELPVHPRATRGRMLCIPTVYWCAHAWRHCWEALYSVYSLQIKSRQKSDKLQARNRAIYWLLSPEISVESVTRSTKFLALLQYKQQMFSELQTRKRVLVPVHGKHHCLPLVVTKLSKTMPDLGVCVVCGRTRASAKMRS